MTEGESTKLSEVSTDIKWIIESIKEIKESSKEIKATSAEELGKLCVRVDTLEDEQVKLDKKQNAIGVKLALIGGALIYGATFAVDKVWAALNGR
jgi:hypothetical protein